jgi:hypothetical protein
MAILQMPYREALSHPRDGSTLINVARQPTLWHNLDPLTDDAALAACRGRWGPVPRQLPLSRREREDNGCLGPRFSRRDA